MFVECSTGHTQADEGAPVRRRQEFYRAPDQRGPLGHCDDAEAAPVWSGGDAAAMVLDLELERVRLIPQTNPRLLCARMPRHIAERLLQHSIYMDANCR